MHEEQRAATHIVEDTENEIRRNHEAAQHRTNVVNANPASEGNLDETPLDEGKATERLAQLGVRCFEMSWQQYNQSHHTTTDALFDLIVTEPPNAVRSGSSKWLRSADECIDTREMDEFVVFSKRVLVSGGYVIVFTSARNWREWVKLFRSHDYSVVDYPFVVIQNTSGSQRTNLLMFPQNICSFAIMAVTPGKHPRGFKPNFEAPYNLFPCSYGRKFAALDNARVVKRKLKFEDSRAPVRTSEQNPDVLAELMVTFSPDGARVLDPYAGTMSVGAACMATNRSCVLIEKDSKCYQLAFKRLFLWSESYTRDTDDEHPVRRRRTVSNSSDMNLDSETTDSIEVNVEELLGITPQASPRRDVTSAHSSREHCQDLDVSGTPDCLLEGRNEQGDAFRLLIGGEIVGQARIQKDPEQTDEVEWRTNLHGYPLPQFAKDDEFLVVIYQVKVWDHCKRYHYPYSYGGVESPV